MRPILLSAGTDYLLEFYARQDGTGAPNASVKASFGTAPTLLAMDRVIISETGLVNGDYQKVEGTFSVTDSGIYYIAIQGKINSTPYYISLDDISIVELLDTDPAPPILIAPFDGATDIPANGFDLQWEANTAGGLPDDYLVYISMDEQAILESAPFITVNTSYDPAIEGQIEFGYEETWYWTVIARRAGVEVASDDVFSFTIEDDPREGLPYTQDFGTDGSFPQKWTQTYAGDLYEDSWSVSNTNNADGTAWEMKNTWQSDSGISRLISTPLDTDGIGKIVVKFKHYLDGYDTGCTGKLQYSHDLIVWHDTGFAFDTNDDIDATEESVYIDNLSAPTTYIAWVMEGNHYQFNYWYIDDVEIGIDFDYPPGVATDQDYIDNEGNTVTVSIQVDGDGGANNYHIPPGDWPDFYNTNYVPSFQFALDLFGKGPWTITVTTTEAFGAFYHNGHWHSAPNIGGQIVFEIPAIRAGGLKIPTTFGGQDPTLPVELSSFTAVLTADFFVKIAWVAESETNHAGYNILRSEVDVLSTALKLNSGLISEGEANGTQLSYQYLDSEVLEDAKYFYWLESLSLNGETDYYGPLAVSILAGGEEQEIPVIPLETKLYSAFPNPFNPATNLRYSMKEAGDVSIQVFNIKGQLIQSFHQSHEVPGYYQVSWNGRDQGGKPVTSGVYFYRMTSGKYSATKKMIMSK